MSRELTRFSSATAVVALVLLACGESKPAASSQNPDSAAQAGASTGPAENIEPAPPPASTASRIGTMPLLRNLPADVDCKVAGEPKTITAEGDFPRRKIVVEIGAGERTYAPATLNISAAQPNAGQEENETFFAGFGADGRIERGLREYFVTGGAIEHGRLLPGDSAAARTLAEEVVRRCGGGS